MDQKVDISPSADGPSLSLTSRIYHRIRSDIIVGALEPGLKLKIEELRQSYGTGASPVREALSLLTSDRLVERIDQRGFRVAHVSAGAFNELLKTRCWLEERALRESIAHGGKDWEEGVVLAHYRLSRTPRSTTSKAFIANAEWEDLHRQFHRALISACGSSTLMRFCEQLYDENIRYRNLAGPSAYPKRDVNKEHEDIVKAALDRDADLAVARLTTHYQDTGAFLAERIGSSEPD